MKKKEIWDYDRTNKASGQSLGSRFLHILLISGCFTAATTVLLSLFFYFFPTQAIYSLHTVQAFGKQLIQALTPEEQPPLQSTSAPRNLQQNPQVTVEMLPSLMAALNSGAETAKSATASLSDIVSEQETGAIPLITFSSSQGNVDNIGQSDKDLFLNGDYLVMLDTAMGPMLYYNQGDSRWGDYLYGGMDPMSQYGCGPTVVAMLVNAFTKHTVIPPNIADWAAANGFHSPHNGSRHAVIPNTLSAYGLQVESAAGADYDTAVSLLRSGHVLIALMGRGTFSSDGHFIIITNILENGNVHIADCYNLENTKMEWDLKQLLAELKHSGDDGSPLWAVSYPPKQQ